ncbi:MAG: hypothetical protein ABSG59_08715 [Verrucomicrobiota bacterium]|jgi:type II secretory pathway predicted ATPase ExeA
MTNPLDAVLDAVEQCRAKPANDYERIIIFLTPCGAARAILGREMVKRLGAVLVGANPLWEERPDRALRDICKRCRITFKPAADADRLENLLLRAFEADPPILAVDNAEHLSRETLDTFTRLVNQTRIVLALLASDRTCRKWQWRWSEQFDQIRRRTHVIVQAD